MQVGDIIKIRNSIGILNVKLIRELDINKIGRNDGLGKIEECRVEFHEDKHGNIITTLYDNINDKRQFYIIDTNYDEVSVFLGEFEGTEEDEIIYTTIRNV